MKGSVPKGIISALLPEREMTALEVPCTKERRVRTTVDSIVDEWTLRGFALVETAQSRQDPRGFLVSPRAFEAASASPLFDSSNAAEGGDNLVRRTP